MQSRIFIMKKINHWTKSFRRKKSSFFSYLVAIYDWLKVPQVPFILIGSLGF